MEKNNDSRKGLFFNQYTLGMRLTSPGKTINEADVDAFAALTGDFSAIHTDPLFAANFHFGQRVVHGLLGLSMAVGLAVQMGFLGDTIIAFREILNWKFSNPIYIGDTIQSVMEVIELKAAPKFGGGLVTMKVVVLNQNNQVVQQGNLRALIKAVPE